MNYTFRGLPSAATVASWLASTGSDFRFSFKSPQRITHILRLKDCGATLTAFAAAIRPVIVAQRFGAVLFQLPPNFKTDVERLASFLQEAASFNMRMAFEFRHESWFSAATYAALEKHNAALCIAESDELVTPDVRTADFACRRLRKSDYSDEDMSSICDRLRTSSERGDVFAYFKHEDEPAGALRAAAVLERLRSA